MEVGHEEGRSAFLGALESLLRTAAGLDDEQLMAASRCRGWSVADVLVHVHLGLQEMLLGVVRPTEDQPDTDAASYWRSPVPTNDPDADATTQVRFVRLVASAYRRPTGLVGHLRPTAEGVATAVGALAPGAVRFQQRVLTTGDFLATWAVELAIHSLDLQRELTLPGPPPAALLLTRRTIETLAGAPLPASWSDDKVALLGAGRVPVSREDRTAAGAVADRMPALG
jgi:uncharacterized protein (TIGR03083 family)